MRPRIPLALSLALLAAACSTGSRAPAVRDGIAPTSGDAPAARSAPALVLGPMVGHTTDRSVTLWAKADRPGDLRAVVTGENGDVREGRAPTDASGIGTVTVDGLEAGVRYAARLELDGVPLPADPPVEFRAFPPEGRPGRFTLALVSCARTAWDSIQPAWRAIDADRPDLVLWLGDNGYLEHADSTNPVADYEDPERIEFRYAQMRGLTSLQPLLRHTAHYAIWDDRDYGDSDDDRTNPLRAAVTRIFERYWANPSYGAGAEIDGIYSTFSIGDVDVFLLDDRFFRDPNEAPDSSEKTLLGSAQKAWLKEGLVDSAARLKIVAIGHQVLADYHEWESYGMFAHEREEILDFVREEGVEGVVFVDGDRHLTELMRVGRADGAPPLYEFTSSPVANRFFEEGLEIPNPIRIDGYAAGPSYGILEIDTTTPEGRLAFIARDVDGREMMRHEIAISELTSTAARATSGSADPYPKEDR